LGKDIYDALFRGKPAIGEYIRINNVPLRWWEFVLKKEVQGTGMPTSLLPPDKKCSTGATGCIILRLQSMQKALKRVR
jgi:hypothetical protein